MLFVLSFSLCFQHLWCVLMYSVAVEAAATEQGPRRGWEACAGTHCCGVRGSRQKGQQLPVRAAFLPGEGTRPTPRGNPPELSINLQPCCSQDAQQLPAKTRAEKATRSRFESCRWAQLGSSSKTPSWGLQRQDRHRGNPMVRHRLYLHCHLLVQRSLYPTKRPLKSGVLVLVPTPTLH